MLNFFKKTKTSSNEELDVTSNYPKEVLEIHNEFNTAADKLLEQANAIIKDSEVNEPKIDRLAKLGFKQAREYVQSLTKLESIKLSKGQIDLIEYYKRGYPYNKFITEEQVMAICHKYGLVCGDVGRFKGFVPDKNLKEVESFKIKPKDDISLKIGDIYILLRMIGA